MGLHLCITHLRAFITCERLGSLRIATVFLQVGSTKCKIRLLDELGLLNASYVFVGCVCVREREGERERERE